MGDVIDLDALLDQSSDEEDVNLPELDRSIEEILRDADDADDDGEFDDQEPVIHNVQEAQLAAPESIKAAEARVNQISQVFPAKYQASENVSRLPRLWESSSLAPSPVLRPGAALAAATAASRQFSIPRRQESSRAAPEPPESSKPAEVEPETSKVGESVPFPETSADSSRAGEHIKADDPPSSEELHDSTSSSYVIIPEPVHSEDSPPFVLVNEAQDFEIVDENEQEEEEIEELLVPEESSSEVELAEFTETNSTSSSSSSEQPEDEQPELLPVSQLDAAEELEKRAANSGLFLEEGAAAQPMQLEGIQRGPPAIGLLELDWGGPLSFALSHVEIMRDHGNPRALAIHSSFIAVGMSKGAVLLSTSKSSSTPGDDNELKILSADKAHASVTVLCFSNLWDLLLVGYLNGTVTLWDVSKASVVKAVTGEHQNAIVHAAFIGQDSSTGRQLKAITADCRGVVMLHTFTLVPLLRRYSVTSQCLLDGQRTGIVLSLSPLALTGSLSSSLGLGPPQLGNDAGRKFLYDGSSSSDEVGGLVVFVTQQIILVFRLVPALEICAKLTRPEGVREGSIPYTSWRTPEKENNSQNPESSFPLLALAWGRKAFVLQLQKAELKKLVEWEIDSKATGVAWLGDLMIVVATAKAELILFTRAGAELERASIRDEEGQPAALAFHTYFLETCNNPEKVYGNSLGVRGGALFVLGASRLWRARLLPWQDRIKALQFAGDWMGAFQIAMELFDGRARGVTGLPPGLPAMQAEIMPNLLGLLSSYIDEAFAYVHLSLGVSEQVSGASREQYARVGRVAIEFCVHISRTDVLFENVFRKFSEVDEAGTFLELLEPYILKDMLSGLAPEIMQALVEHYSGKGWLQRVEQCILHMDIASLDFNQVMRLCREHGLFSALIYLFNKGLNDFKSPLDELLAAAQDQTRENSSSFGYKLLVYLKYCFSGLAFPPGRGSLPSSQLQSLRKQLLEYLLDPAGSGAESEYAVFPRLHFLLNLDVEATLEVFTLALTSENSNSSSERTYGEKELLQLTIDALVHIVETVLCMDSEAESTTKQILLFIARFVSGGDSCIPPTTLHRILELLITGEQPGFEDLVVSLLKIVPGVDWEPREVLELADRACFWQVSALVHSRKGDHISALRSHLKDHSRPYETFSFVISKLDPETGLKDDSLVEFRDFVKSRIPELLEQDRTAAVYVILEYFGDQVEQVIQSLDPSPMALFALLRSVLEIQSYAMKSRENEEETNVDHPWNDRLRLVSLLDTSKLEITDEMVELYVELLCQHDPEKVLDFLRSYENYRVEKCLKLCQRFGVKDGAAYLLEHVGDVGSALTLVLSDLSSLFHDLDGALATHFPASNTSEEKALSEVKNSAVSLCQRNTFRLDPQEAESLWFHLLDRFVHPLQALAHDRLSKHSQEKPSHYQWRVLHVDGAPLVIRKIFSKLAEEVVTGMIGYVPLQAILSKIVSDYGNHELGDFKAAILEMLSAYNYEHAILDTAKRIIEADMFQNSEALRAGRSRGISPRTLRCSACELGFETGSSRRAVQVFACGHLVHLDCLKPSSTPGCPICIRHEILAPLENLPLKGKSPVEQKLQQKPPVKLPTPKRIGGASRFDVLKSLQKGEPLLEMNPELKLKLSPPVVYKNKPSGGSIPRASSSSSSISNKRLMSRPLFRAGSKSKQ